MLSYVLRKANKPTVYAIPATIASCWKSAPLRITLIEPVFWPPEHVTICRYQLVSRKCMRMQVTYMSPVIRVHQGGVQNWRDVLEALQDAQVRAFNVKDAVAQRLYVLLSALAFVRRRRCEARGGYCLDWQGDG